MANVPQTPDLGRKRQKGALMAGVVAMLAISLIWSAVAFQAWIDVLRRDNEAEMIFRAQEIVRAIQRYRRDHGGQGPLKLKDLLDPSPRLSYYLRREYDDPLVRDGKWGLLHMGPGGTIIDPHELAEDGGLGLLGGGPTAGSRRSEGWRWNSTKSFVTARLPARVPVRIKPSLSAVAWSPCRSAERRRSTRKAASLATLGTARMAPGSRPAFRFFATTRLRPPIRSS